MHNGLATTKYDLLPGEKREMLLQPGQLFRQRLRKLHSGRHNEQFVLPVYLLNHELTSLIRCHRTEKVLPVRKLLHDVVVARKAHALLLVIETVAVYAKSKFPFVIIN